MSIVGSNALAGASGQSTGGGGGGGGGGFRINRSLRFNSGDTPELTRTPSSTGNTSTFTISFWVKRCKLGSTQMIIQTGNTYANLFRVYWDGNDNFRFHQYNGSYVMDYTTSAKYRDVGAWYHFVIALDTTQAAAADRAKLYVNGVEVTDFSATTNPAQNLTTGWNAAIVQRIGREYTTTYGNYYNYGGYIAEFHNVDGQQLAPTDFGELDTNNVWQPKEFEGSHNAALAKHQGDWESDTTGTAYASTVSLDKSFDGNDSTGSAPQAGTAFVFTPSTAITGITKVRIRATRDPSQSDDHDFKLNNVNIGGSWTAGGGVAEVEFTVNNLTSIQWSTKSNAHWYKLHKVEIYYDGSYHTLTSGVASVNGFHLNFSDNSSNAALGTDSSGNSNTWTVNNLVGTPNFGITSAASITATQYITFPITYTSTLTYEFFVLVTTASTYTYFAHDNTGPSLWNLAINASGSLLFGNYNGGWTTFTSTGLTDGNWHFVRLTTTGSSTSLYIDGVLNATNASGGGATTGLRTNKLYNGAYKIAHLRITTGGTPPTTGIPSVSSMNQAAGTGGTLAFYDALDDIAGSGTKTSDGGNVTITMAAATASVAGDASASDSFIDTPTNYTADSGNNGGNYCTLNPLKNQSQTLKNGNLESNGTSGRSTGTLYASSGKFYWEFTAGSSYTMAGIESSTSPQAASYPGENNQQYALYGNNGSGLLYHNGSTTSVDGFVSGDVIGVALDMDGGNLYFYKNGSAMNSGNAAATGLTGAWTANCRSGSGGYNGDTVFNFGQRPFAYTPPTGYKSLCTTNLPDPTIADGSTAFDTKLWTGDDATSRAITGLNFSPDFLWIKNRASAWHAIADSVRGAGKILASNSANAEYDNSDAQNAIQSFDSNGFTIGDQGGWSVNGNNSAYVGWTWDGGDLATNSAYNQSRKWSDELSASYDNEPWRAFDGNLTTTASGQNTAQSVTWTPVNGLAYTSSVRAYTTYTTYQGVTAGFSLNGGTQVETASAGWYTLASGSGTITSITHSYASAYRGGINAIEVDGKILVDSGVIPVGGLNSSVYNQSQTWSGLWTGTAGYGSFANLHNANVDSDYVQTLNGTMTLSSALTITSLRIKLNRYGANVTLSVNGTDVTSQLPAGGSGLQWVTITGFTSLSSIAVTGNDYSSNVIGLYAIEINGALLIDSGVSVTNVPTIASTVRANPSAGFSIVSWTGNGTSGEKIAHGLNATPKVVIFKNRDTASTDWRVYTTMVNGSLDFLFLNLTSAKSDSGLATFTSTTFTAGSSNETNGNGDAMIAYCFAPVEGYSAFGSYTGNGSADGPFVYTGMRPKFVLLRNTSRAENWVIYDDLRSDFNAYLAPNTNDAEGSFTQPVFALSNGFQLGDTRQLHNRSGDTYIYAAFAEHPFKTARAR